MAGTSQRARQIVIGPGMGSIQGRQGPILTHIGDTEEALQWAWFDIQAHKGDLTHIGRKSSMARRIKRVVSYLKREDKTAD